MPQKRPGSSTKIQIGPKKKIGLICSGGATKAGAFHLGVALALREQGFKFFGGMQTEEGPAKVPGPMEISTYVGSSAGSMITSLLAAGYSIDNIFNAFLDKKSTDPLDLFPRELPKLTYQQMFKFRREHAKEQLKQVVQIKSLLYDLMKGNIEALLQMRWLSTTGLFSTSGIEQYLREQVLPCNRFEDLAADLFVVATQLNHSRKVVFGKYSYQPPPHDVTCQYNNDVTISDACAASMALPFVYAPYAIPGDNDKTSYFIDGEVRDTLSTHVGIDAGCDLIIASYTHQPYHFSKAIGSLTEQGLPSLLVQSLYLLIEQKINNHRHNKEIQRSAIQSVSQYCQEQHLEPHIQKRIIEIMEHELHHNSEVDTIYIHPSPDDTNMFFREHFSLSPNRMAETVKSGFRATIDTLRKYDFADREPRRPAMGSAT